MATELTISVAVGSVSQTTISKSPVIGQNVRLISASTIAIQALGQDGVINVAKILHATEQDASLMQFKIRETANAENMRINKLYLAIRNSDSTLTSYKLFDALNTQTPISSTVPSNKGEVRFDNVSLTVPKGGEKTLLVKASVVSGTTLPSTDTHRDNLRIMISFVEFNGVTSGTTTRVSGGVVIGQASTDSGAVEGTFTAEEPNNFLMVNDPNNMEIGDLVRIDANDDGVFTSTALTNNLLESAPHYIKTVGTKAVTLAAYFKATTNANANATFTLVNGAAGLPTDSALGIADSEGQIAATDQVRIDVNNDGDFDDTTPVNETVTYTVSAFTDGAPDTFQAGLDTSTSGALTTPFGVYVITKTQDTGQLGNTSTSVRQAKLTNYGFASEPHNVQEVEPVIARTGDASKTGTPNIETEMSVFKILAEGVRALETSKIRFEISGSYNFNGGFGPKDFKLDRANPGTGERITGTMTPTGALANPSIVYTPSAGSVGNALVAGAKAAGQTSITIDDGAGGASNISLLAGDRVTFTADTNGGVGYRLVTVTSTQLTVTPALQVGIADNAAITKVTTTNPTLAASSLLESGAVIEFDLDAAGLREEIDSGSSKAYVVLADTTNIKNTGAQGATASSLVRMLGNKATVGANNSLTWHYRLTSNGLDSGALTLSDSYIVTGTNLNF